MISREDTDLGITVKKLRKAKGMSRIELSEAAGISESHLKKIETGARRPGSGTYQKVITVLEAEIVIKGIAGTVKSDCAARAQKVFMESTETQALYLVKMLEDMAEGLKILQIGND